MDLRNLRIQISFDESSEMDFDPFWEVYDIESGVEIPVTPEVQAAAFHMMRLCSLRLQQDTEFQLTLKGLEKSIEKIK